MDFDLSVDIDSEYICIYFMGSEMFFFFFYKSMNLKIELFSTS